MISPLNHLQPLNGNNRKKLNPYKIQTEPLMLVFKSNIRGSFLGFLALDNCRVNVRYDPL